MSGGAGYDVVVDVDEEVREATFYLRPSLRRTCVSLSQLTYTQGDLGHTDLQEDLEFHSSNFNTDASSNSRKIPGGSSGLPPPATAGGGSSKRFLWTLSFYSQFFDVDTNSVLSRCWAALFPRANFLDVLEGNPDLYGPFWIATTVVFILFLGGTISQYFAQHGTGHFAYNFRLLSGTISLYIIMASLTLSRCRWTHIRLHLGDPRCPLHSPQVFRQRIREPPRMLGFIWLLKSDLDPRCIDLLVTNHDLKLGVRGHWFWTQRYLLIEELVPSTERYG